jgi:hypothetical protein
MLLAKYIGMSLLIVAVAKLSGCVDIDMEQCGHSPNPLGNNDPGSARVRTSHYRAVLADTSLAAGRVLPYALMSAYAYNLGEGCADPGNRRPDPAVGQPTDLQSQIAKTVNDPASQWVQIPALSIRDAAGHLGCEDDEGLAYHVWERNLNGQKLVVVAFRGTSGDGDWKYGNL